MRSSGSSAGAVALALLVAGQTLLRPAAAAAFESTAGIAVGETAISLKSPLYPCCNTY